MGERPQMVRMDSVEANDRDLEQVAKEATLLSMIIAQQQQRESERLQDEAYKQTQSFLDAVAKPLDDINDAEFAAEMARLVASGKSLKRRRPHRRGTTKHRRRHRGTKKHRRRHRGTKKHRRRHRGTKKHRRHRRGT